MARVKKESLAIVLAEKYNNSTNVLFMMKTDDFRYDTDNYKHVAFVVERNKEIGKYNTDVRPVKSVIADNDKTYNLYSDWSLKEVV